MDDDDDLDGDYDNYENGVMMGRQPREINSDSNSLQVFHFITTTFAHHLYRKV
jgi:hypothetical protein